jgi:hypothetical protein
MGGVVTLHALENRAVPVIVGYPAAAPAGMASPALQGSAQQEIVAVAPANARCRIFDTGVEQGTAMSFDGS